MVFYWNYNYNISALYREIINKINIHVRNLQKKKLFFPFNETQAKNLAENVFIKNFKLVTKF